MDNSSPYSAIIKSTKKPKKPNSSYEIWAPIVSQSHNNSINNVTTAIPSNSNASTCPANASIAPNQHTTSQTNTSSPYSAIMASAREPTSFNDIWGPVLSQSYNNCINNVTTTIPSNSNASTCPSNVSVAPNQHTTSQTNKPTSNESSAMNTMNNTFNPTQQQLSRIDYNNFGSLLLESTSQKASYPVYPHQTLLSAHQIAVQQSTFNTRKNQESTTETNSLSRKCSTQPSKRICLVPPSSIDCNTPKVTALSQLSHLEDSLEIIDDPEYVTDAEVDSLRLTKELQLSIDKVFDTTKIWQSELPIECFVQDDTVASMNDLLVASDPVHKATRIKNEKPFMFFSKTKFPTKGGFDGEGFVALKRYLGRCASEEGYNICTTRTYKYVTAGKTFKKFNCVCSVHYQNNCNKNLDRSNLRQVQRHNDRAANRKGGKRLARNAFSFRPDKDSEYDVKCPFTFQIGMSPFKGFYVRPGFGCRMHHGHVRAHNTETNAQAKHMSEEERQHIRTLGRACLMRSEQRNLFFEKTKRMLSVNSFAHMERLNCELNDIDDVRSKSSADKLIAFLHKKKYNYVILSDKIDEDTNEHILVSQNFNCKTFEVEENVFNTMDEKERSEALELSKKLRLEYNMEDSQQLLLAIAWVVPSEERLFSLNPRVIGMDTFKKSNKEKRPLFTVTGKTTESDMFTILRVFMPNEQAWMFQWILQECFSKLFPLPLLLEVRAIISDGDSSEYTQIDNMITTICRNAIRLRCIFHIITQGWKYQGPKLNSSWTALQQKWYHWIAQTVSDWLYSWSRQGIYNETSFKLSAYFLYNWLTSKPCVENMGEDFIKSVIEFIRRHVLPHKSKFLWCLRLYVDHSDDCSNSCHEGTNTGITFGAARVTPRDNLDKAAKTMSYKASVKTTMLTGKMQKHLLSKRKGAKLEKLDMVTRKCYSLVLKEYDVHEEYMHIRTGQSTFLVTNIDNDGKIYQPHNRKYDYNKGPIPRFIWIHEITVVNNIMFCSCGHFQRHGYPCRHVIYLIMAFDPNWTPTHHDVKVRWWNIYSTYVYIEKKDDNKLNTLDALMRNLKENDTKGTFINPELYENEPICTVIPDDWDKNVIRCANYDLTKINKSSIENFSLTQYTQKTVIQNDSLFCKAGSINITQEMECILNDAHDEASAMFSQQAELPQTTEDVGLKETDVYHRLMPAMKELIETLQGSERDPAFEADVVKQINTWTSVARGRQHRQRHGVTTPVGHFVSACPDSELSHTREIINKKHK